MLVLSYLGILSLIPLFAKKEDREVQWHAKNGLAMFIAYVIVYIGWMIISHFLRGTLGCALSFIGCAIWLAYLALIIMAIMKAVKGERLVLPVISDFANK